MALRVGLLETREQGLDGSERPAGLELPPLEVGERGLGRAEPEHAQDAGRGAGHHRRNEHRYETDRPRGADRGRRRARPVAPGPWPSPRAPCWTMLWLSWDTQDQISPRAPDEVEALVALRGRVPRIPEASSGAASVWNCASNPVAASSGNEGRAGIFPSQYFAIMVSARDTRFPKSLARSALKRVTKAASEKSQSWP